MEIKILYEDENVVVIDKPAGVVVNRAESVKGETLQDWMEKKFKIQNLNFKTTDDELLFFKRSGVVHRLDKDTSGVMVLSKNPEVMLELMRQFKERETEKTYVALAHGKLEPDRGEIRVPLSRTRQDRRKFGVVLGGKMTVTSYLVLERFEGSSNYQDGFSLVELHPKSGRTHQLRVVLKHLGHVIVGDGHYLGRKRAKADEKWCKRQFLHAKSLCFKDAITAEKVCFSAELPHELADSLEYVRKMRK